MSVLHTAIAQPRFTRAIIAREHLEELLDKVDASRVTSVCAPAGYGKTTAILDWSRALEKRGRPLLWVSGRAGIDSAEAFCDALSSAAQKAGLDYKPIGPDIAFHFADAASRHPARPLLVIDDAQLLPAEALGLVSQIVANARDGLTTIIASRGRPRIPVARLRSLGVLLEVGIADLRFSLSEAAELLRDQRNIAIEDLTALIEITRGWAAGIVMARQLDRSSWALESADSARLTGLRREFADYLYEKVLSRQPQQIKDFLIETSVLSELTPAACAAVTGSADSDQLLEAVHEAGLFLEAVDEGRRAYAYHPFFRELVMRRLIDRDPARASELHRRASRHFVAMGQSILALDHAEASHDQEFLADQLECLAEPLTYEGHLYRIDELGAGLPWHMLAERPTLMLCLAWRRLRSLAFRPAAMMIDTAEACVQRREAAGLLDQHALTRLRFYIEHRRIMLSAAMDDMAAVERRAETLLKHLGDDHAYLSCTLLAQLMSARRELYHFHDILRLEAETRRALERPGSRFASIALKATVAPTLAVQGKTDAARAMLEEALALAQSIGGEGSGLAALPALPLAELAYEGDNLARAESLVERYLPVARHWAFADQLASGYLVNAKLLASRGEIHSAVAALEEAHLVSIEYGLNRLRAFIVAEQVRLLIRGGQPAQAEAAFRAGEMSRQEEPVPTAQATRQHESVATAWLRLEMQSQRLSGARRVAKRWSEFARRNGAIRSSVNFELLLAEIAVLAGDRSEARRALREAISLAAPAGWVRVFLDEGETIGALLVEAYGDGPKLDDPVDRFAARLVTSFRGVAEDGPEEQLGQGGGLVRRELDILRMVGGGLRNREIGDRLGLTEGTVKWYMQQIYDKLGVRRRPQAVMRARQLGILT